ncbi:MAG: BLUF domain-containing protein [Pseudomonadota bacterium]
MKQLIYRSQPFGFDRAILAGILTRARRNNQRDDISGALICRQDLYLQLIEGPINAIDALFARISVDDRHCDVRLMLVDDVEARMFPEWSMLDDTAPSMSWSPQEIGGGAIDSAPPAAIRQVFERVAIKARAAGATPAIDTA